MKRGGRKPRAAASAPPATRGVERAWIAPVAAGLAGVVAWAAYSPALNGAFVFDDEYLPMFRAGYTDAPLALMRGVRPLLMLTYAVNYRLGGLDPGGYHVVNLLLHFLASGLITLVLARLLERAGVGGTQLKVLSAFGGGLFLLHPIQTEPVAYVAGRSEPLSVALYFAAFAVFLYRPAGPVSWKRALFILMLTGAALAAKEHTLTLPVLLLATDLFWDAPRTRENAKLYGLLATAGAVGGWYVWRVLEGSPVLGGTPDSIAPVEYFFTQCRVIWMYVRLFFAPFGQNADWDVALSPGFPDAGAILGLIALLALSAAAWVYRKQWPLAAFGVFVFLLLLVPTSSVVPIADVMAERRLYLPFLGLALVCLELLRRLPAARAATLGIVVLAVCAVLTYQRAQVWASPLALWLDTVANSPAKVRPNFQLAFAYYDLGRCAEASRQYAQTSELAAPTHDLLVDWALALECDSRDGEAVDRLEQAAAVQSTAHVYSLLGMVHGKHGRAEQALAALAEAERIDPTFDMVYLYRGNVYEAGGNHAAAASEYQRALGLNARNDTARDALRRLAGAAPAPLP